MVETISPVGYGTRARWVGSLALHALGATVTAAAFGAALGAAGGLLGAPWGRAGAIAVAVVAVVYAGRELLGLPVPVPQWRRQVPDWWRTFFGRPLAALLYGAGLGVGFLTYLSHGTLVVVAVAVAATGRPWIGAAAMAPFGLARGIAPLVAARVRSPEDGRRLVERLAAFDDRIRSVLNGSAIVVVAAIAIAIGWRSHGGWSAFAAATLAATFAWASASKLLRPQRWRRAMAAQNVPRPVEVVALWVVPLIEALIPVLTVLGRERAAAAVAFGALAVFTVAIVRSAIRVGVRVPCGCFGRPDVDARGAFARNLALAGLAGVSWVAAGRDPSLIAPSRSDVLPIALTLGGLLAAAITARLAGSMLSRGGT